MIASWKGLDNRDRAMNRTHVSLRSNHIGGGIITISMYPLTAHIQ